MFSAPHGAVCAALLPPVMRANTRALAARQPQSPALRRYDEVARILTGRPEATAADGVAWVAELAADVGIPSLSAWGMSAADIPTLVEKGAAASSMKANPIALTEEELAGILENALG
jgi:alcohol dehydrogenase class IV